MAPATQASLVTKKAFSFRGTTAVWSNRYYLSETSVGGTDADKDTVSDTITDAEAAALPPSVQITEALWYDGSSGVPIHTKAYTKDGTLADANLQECPGDCAVIVRYSTDALTTKHHPIYLYNYYHGACISSAGDVDTVLTAQKTAFETLADDWLTGFDIGGTTYRRAGPRGAVAQARVVSGFVKHRDFPGA